MFKNWGFLLGEIWGLILLAALLGLFCGWLIWSRRKDFLALQGQLDARERELTASRSELIDVRGELDGYNARFADLETEKQTLVHARDAALSDVDARNSRIIELEAHIQDRETQIADWEHERVALVAERESVSADLSGRDSRIADLEAQLSASQNRLEASANLVLERDEALDAKRQAEAALAEEIFRLRKADEERDRLKGQLATAAGAAASVAAMESQLSAAKADAGRVRDLEAEVARLGTFERQISNKDARIADLEAQLGDVEALRNQSANIASLEATIGERDAQINALRADAERVRTLEANLAERDAEIARLRDAAGGADAATLRAAAERVPTLEAQIAQQTREYETLKRDADAARQEAQRLAEMQTALNQCRDTVASRDAVIDDLRAQMTAATRDYDGDGVLEGRNEGTKPQTLTVARGGVADDLKRIKGVGPKLEALLHKLGFFHYDQIASWTADEVAWVDANLDGFNGRVSRDRWIDQARVLAQGGMTEFASRVDDGDVYE